jgi:hypothetical protein
MVSLQNSGLQLDMNNLNELTKYNFFLEKKPYRFDTTHPMLGEDGYWYAMERITEGSDGAKTNEECFFQAIVKHDSIEEMLKDPGIYTWALFDDNSFRAIKIFSINEMCGKHMTIHKQIGKPLVLAGEANIKNGPTGPIVHFNLLSGTYMDGNLHDNTNKTIHYGQKMVRRFREAKAADVHFDTDTKSYISEENLLITPDILRMYENAGFYVYRFGTGEQGKRDAQAFLKNEYWNKYKRLREVYNMSFKSTTNVKPPYEEWFQSQIQKKDGTRLYSPREEIPHERIRLRAHPNFGPIVPGFQKGNVFRTTRGGSKGGKSRRIRSKYYRRFTRRYTKRS